MNSESLTNPDAAALLERQVQTFLAGGKFRKARDEAKLLRKLDPARGLPLLIRANVGLARDMMAKRQVSEAEQVLAYLATIASPAELVAVQAEMAGHTGNFSEAAPGALRRLAEAGASLPESERWRLADLAVVAFGGLPTGDPATERVVVELRAIQDALRAVTEREWGAAQDALRPLPQSSAFSHWKLFLKGLIAFHQDDMVRAARCFAGLPSETLPAKAGVAYQWLLGTGDGPAARALPAESTIESASRLAGHPGLGRVLYRAEQLWRERKPGPSYGAVRDGLAQFPSERPDLVGALTDFYFNSLFNAAPPICERLAEWFDRWLEQRKPGHALERALMLRALSQFYLGSVSAIELKLNWHGFIEAYEMVHGPDPRLASLAYGWLGEQLAAAPPREAIAFFGRPQAMFDSAGAVAALERSVNLDPLNLEAALRLCDVYEALRRPSERNRLLDAMVEQFPENKAVLLRAARRCVDRKAFAKGLDYLARARALDLLDPGLIHQTVRALFGQAGEHFKRQRPGAARAALDQVLALAVDQPANLACGRWCLLTRRAAIEEALGDPALADDLLAQARVSCPAPEALLLYAHLAQLASQRARTHQSTRFSREFVSRHLKSASARHALLLLRIQEFWAGLEDEESPTHLDDPLVRQYLAAAQKTPFTDDEARRLAEHVRPESASFHAVTGFARRVLARDPKHPWFRLFQLTSQDFGLEGGAAETRELEAIVEEANRRGDAETAQRAQGLLDRPPSPDSPFPPPPETWMDPKDDEAEDEEMGRGGLPAGFDQLDPNAAGQIEEIIALLGRLSERELQKTRKSMLKSGMPALVFDTLAEAARGGGPVPDLSPTLKPKPPESKPPPRDPNQLDLF
ncbi:MAG: tetratricopeptide repeat protein [Limisphaerales bacterium]